MDTLRQWILTLAATGMICGAAKALTPKGSVKKAVTAVCGFAMMAAVLSVAGDVDALGISRYAAKYSQEAREYIDTALDGASRQTRFIIEDRCEAYILDKAADMGLSVDRVEVTAQWSEEGFWYPVRARISGREDPELSQLMEAELGILREDQEWSAGDEG